MRGSRLTRASQNRMRRIRNGLAPLCDLLVSPDALATTPAQRARRVALVKTVAAVALALLSLDGAGADVEPPAIAVRSNASAPSQAAITIEWCDDDALVPPSRFVTLNGEPVTVRFSYETVADPVCGAAARSVGTVALRPGQNTIVARIRDTSLNWGEAAVTLSAPAVATSPTPRP